MFTDQDHQKAITFKPKSSTKLLQLTHSDVCAIHGTPTRGEKKYFVTFIDDYSKYCYVYLMHAKSEVLKSFMTYKLKQKTNVMLR